jgi:quinol monooxygenase YgiN
MFTRIVETRAKAGKTDELYDALSSKVLPILRAQPGFVDLITLTATDNPAEAITLSIWNSQQDAEKYQREQFNKIADILKPLVEREPVVRTFNMEVSTAHKIAKGRAA